MKLKKETAEAGNKSALGTEGLEMLKGLEKGVEEILIPICIARQEMTRLERVKRNRNISWRGSKISGFREISVRSELFAEHS
ncbi:hypothetical protein OS493_038831 [Desmophyllum pertusum]|uniref:Uncharacterized protein n=1 Tax=Desmophyllum pertusum TaxID=174260 RepID=A0A9W9YU01_9CNID|nr:hypothetical protein OS493_038831 [Desmophyllum pertusum]